MLIKSSERGLGWCCYHVSGILPRYFVVSSDTESCRSEEVQGTPGPTGALTRRAIHILPHAIILSQAALLDFEAKPRLLIWYVFVNDIQGKRKVILPHITQEAVQWNVSQTSVALIFAFCVSAKVPASSRLATWSGFSFCSSITVSEPFQQDLRFIWPIL